MLTLTAGFLLAALGRQDLRLTQQFQVPGNRLVLHVAAYRADSASWRIDRRKVALTYKRSNPAADGILELPQGPVLIPATSDGGGSYIDLALTLKESRDVASWYSVNADVFPGVIGQSTGRSRNSHGAAETFYVPKQAIDLAALRSRWVGRKVWILGAGAYIGTDYDDRKQEVWSPMQPAVIEDVMPSQLDWANVGFSPEWNGGGTAGFDCYHPLMVRFKLPAMAVHRWPSGVGPTGPDYVPPMPGVHREVEAITLPARIPSRSGWALVSDEAEMSRLLRLTSPGSVLQTCSPAIRDAFRRRQVVRGMPQELVVRLIGYPALDRSPEEFKRDRNWIYQAFAPLTYELHFDSKHRVREASMVGDLPGD